MEFVPVATLSKKKKSVKRKRKRKEKEKSEEKKKRKRHLEMLSRCQAHKGHNVQQQLMINFQESPGNKWQWGTVQECEALYEAKYDTMLTTWVKNNASMTAF